MTSSRPVDQHEAADALLKYVFSGVLGPTKGMGVQYALMYTTDSTFAYSVSLEPDKIVQLSSIDRYHIEVDRHTKNVSTPKKIEITDEDMQMAILAATGETVVSSSRFADGGFSISYKVTTNKPNAAYVVQLRHHGNVASMDALMKFVLAKNRPGVIPMPAVYSIPGEAEHQKTTGFGRQIAEFIPGVIAESVYPDMSHTDRLVFVRKMALAWQACWDLPLSSPRQIGELIATESEGKTTLTVGPDRHYSLGGPFATVREWLQGRIRQAVSSLERASGIDDFKDEYMASIKAFVNTHLDQVPTTVEECSVVAVHVDMGLHNVIVSADDHTDIKAIIDWEFLCQRPVSRALRMHRDVISNGRPKRVRA